MKTALNVILFKVILIFTASLAYSASSSKSNGETSCEVEGTFGGKCKATCVATQRPVCKAVLISPECGCDDGLRSLPNLTNALLDDIAIVRAHCLSSQSAGLNGLVPFIDDVVNNATNNNQVRYDTAETAYVDYFLNTLSYNDKSEINNLVISLGHPGFTI
jgi:hypothetical protein